MKVYVVERGCYSSRYVQGVYGSLEEAKAASVEPGERWSEPDEPEEDRLRSWSNGLDWDNAADITEYEVKEA
jgi:hypothetical protein